MNGKIVGAFISGAVLASGIVYMAVRPTALQQPTPAVNLRQIEVPSPAPSSKPQVEPEATTPPQSSAPKPKPKPLVRTPNPPQQRARLSERPIREKQSPMPPVRHNEPATIAKNEARTPDPFQAPAPQPTPDHPQTQATVQAPIPPPPAAHQPQTAPTQSPVVVSSTPIPVPTTDARQPHTVILAAGTQLMIRIGETVSADRNQIGDTFFGTLEQPLVIDGFIICERGSRVIGRVTEATPAGRAGGQSHLSIELTRLNTSDRQRVEIRTEPYSRDGLGSVGGDLPRIGPPIGSGPRPGTGIVLIANGRSVEVPFQSRVTFRVKEPVTITEKLD
jgi:hypothetical protein